MTTENSNDLINGPLPGVSYPLKVAYCGECTLPPEYCDHGASAEKCKEWLKKNLPDVFSKLHVSAAVVETDVGDQASGDKGDDKKPQKRGGKGLPKAPKAKTVDQKISLSRAPRGKNKFVTVVGGLATYEIDLKTASKFFSQRFACGSSVTGPDEIVIQGDVKDDLYDILPEKWPQIDEDNIDDLGDLKRS